MSKGLRTGHSGPDPAIIVIHGRVQNESFSCIGSLSACLSVYLVVIIMHCVAFSRYHSAYQPALDAGVLVMSRSLFHAVFIFVPHERLTRFARVSITSPEYT